MDTIIKLNLDDLFRYLLSVVFIILGLRLLTSPEVIASFSVLENSGNTRTILGICELAATLMFMADKTKILGGIILLLLLGYGAYLHQNNGSGIPLGLTISAVGILFVLLVDIKRRSLKKVEK